MLRRGPAAKPSGGWRGGGDELNDVEYALSRTHWEQQQAGAHESRR